MATLFRATNGLEGCPGNSSRGELEIRHEVASVSSARSHSLAITELLLSAGANVRRRNRIGRTALHYAVGAGRAAVDLLLAAGADPNAQDNEGATPLHVAIERGNVSAIEALRHGGASSDVRDALGRTPAELVSEHHDVFTATELEAVKRVLVLWRVRNRILLGAPSFVKLLCSVWMSRDRQPLSLC
jgi:hypothetical protein